MALFPDEELVFPRSDSSETVERSDKEINEKYVKGVVRIVTEQARYPLNTIVNMVESKTYRLNPAFQRRYRWDKKRQSRLIESFIINVPIPPIFLYEDRYSHYEVMDGLQRITAIYEFYKDKLVLEDLEEWPELNGRKYSELPEQVRLGIDRRYLSSIILLQETAKNEEEARRLKQLVFERINSGGVKLEDQESRNAYYDGPLNRRCKRLARNPYLCKTWGIPEPDQDEIDQEEMDTEKYQCDNLREIKLCQRMLDVELVLRFFAYRQRQKLHRGSLKSYLDNFLKYGNDWPEDVLINLENLFIVLNTTNLTYHEGIWESTSGLQIGSLSYQRSYL